MNTRHLETQNQPEAETHLDALEPVSTVETEGSSDPQSALEAEIQQSFQYMQMRSTDRWFMGSLRETWASRPIKTNEADRLLQMSFDEVLAVLEEERQRHSAKRRFRRRLFLGLIALTLLTAALTRNTDFLISLWVWVLYLVIGVAPPEKQGAAALALVRFDDVRAVGPLAEALKYQPSHARPIAAKALIRLLPRLQASDAALLSPVQRACLNKALLRDNTELTLAILKSYERVGDAAALSEVQQLANIRRLKIRRWARRMFYRSMGAKVINEIPKSQISKVAAAAEECLPFLRQSTERRQSDQELLRPSDGNRTPSEDLLRPAAPQSTADPSDQLLRPTDTV